jgi:phytoene synthase
MGFPSGVGDPVAVSYAWCRALAKERAKNFYYSFRLLSKKQHDAICAVYAFMRVCDDLSDDPGMSLEQRQAALAGWRRDLDLALGGLQTMPRHPVWLALYDAVLKYKIPRAYLHQMIDGVTSDLEFRPVETFDQLYRYCYQVASVVGLTVIHIFGFKGEAALPLAEKCGIAFQLTNIIRDVREDAENGRVYLPGEDLARFGVRPEQLKKGPRDDAFRNLMRFEAERARRYYDESRPLVDLVDPGSRASLRALIEIYSQLLDRIVASDFDVLTQRIALTTWEKVWILVRERLRG